MQLVVQPVGQRFDYCMQTSNPSNGFDNELILVYNLFQRALGVACYCTTYFAVIIKHTIDGCIERQVVLCLRHFVGEKQGPQRHTI